MADEKKKATKEPTAQEQALEGTHPAVPVSEGDHHAGAKSFADNPDKPGPDSVAQVENVPDDWPTGR